MRRILGMLVKKLSPVGKTFMFLAYRQYLWIGANQDAFNRRSEELMPMIIEGHPFGAELELDASDVGDVLDFARDRLRDAVMGEYNRETRTIWLWGSEHSVKTSPLIRKVVQTLGARTVSYETPDDKTHNVKRGQIRGDWNWDKPFYHGTSTKYFGPIAKVGLKPIPGQTNYPDIHHDELIFLTTRFDEARYHAFHTATGGGQAQRARMHGRRVPTSGLPMVVATKIPDPQLVVPDFDVDAFATRSEYEHTQDQSQYYSVPSEKASKHAGLLGYKGRIPSKFFTMILVWSPYGNKWIRIVPANFFKVMARIDNYGDDFWTTYYGDLSVDAY